VIQLSEEQRTLVEDVRELAENVFAEKAFEWRGTAPLENVAILDEKGYSGVNFSPEYGGRGMTEFEAMLVVEQIGRVCPDTAELVLTQQFVGPRAIDMYGTDAVKEKYLPDVISGESAMAIAISEPEAGSDVRSMNTSVTEHDGELLLDGEKTWVGYVPNSDAAVVWAKFPEGMGAVVIDFDSPGVEIEEEYTNMRGFTQTHFSMSEVPVPEENVLVRGDDAFKSVLRGLNWERLGTATLPNSFAWGAFEKALEYAQERTQFGQPIGDFQGIEWKLADMATKLQSSRTLAYHAAITAQEQGRVPDPLTTSMAKLQAGQVGEEIVSEALQIHGARGYQQGHPLEYLYRFARAYRIAGGTDGIQRNAIASRLKNGESLSLV
jgi:alkylation response protein AidB-like acyl-CoA dehydrogenase